MAEYRPHSRTQLVAVTSFLLVVLPAIFVAGMSYIWFLEHWLQIDMEARAEGVVDGLLMLATTAPMLPVMLLAIVIAGVPWMFCMARFLSWLDVRYYTRQKEPRIPWLSDRLERLWLRMILARRKAERAKRQAMG